MDRKHSDILSEVDSSVIEISEVNTGQRCDDNSTTAEAKDKANDLKHSRPLDIHVWSNLPEMNAFVDAIYDEHFLGRNKKTGINTSKFYSLICMLPGVMILT